jgi:osmoprotectant transport system permease protein
MPGFLSFPLNHYARLFTLLAQHLELVCVSEALALVFAIPVGYFLSKARWACDFTLGLFSVLYSIPSLAMFTFFLPYTGLGSKTAILVIAIYAQFILLRSAVSGFQSVSPAIIEVGRGLGINQRELFMTVELPLASPVIVAGIRISAVTSTAIATIAATIGGGGLGTLLFEGLRTLYTVKIVWAVILSAILSLSLNFGLQRLENLLLKRARGEVPSRKLEGALR